MDFVKFEFVNCETIKLFGDQGAEGKESEICLGFRFRTSATHLL